MHGIGEDAREAIYEIMALGGQVRGRTGGGVGYCWASAMLSWFLGASGSDLDITFRSSDDFPQEPGIVRATRGIRDPQTGIITTDTFCVCGIEGCADEPDCVTPLLWEFLQKYVRPVATAGKFSVPPRQIKGRHLYSDELPRPYDTGWWAAFGHVEINGTFSAKGRQSCHPEGYVIRYWANYHIEDHYHWREGWQTPLPLPGTDGVQIPHEWAISLERANPPRAQEYKFTISWAESERILVGFSFSWYRPAAWWEGLF